jgi:hypothetical protein
MTNNHDNVILSKLKGWSSNQLFPLSYGSEPDATQSKGVRWDSMIRTLWECSRKSQTRFNEGWSSPTCCGIRLREMMAKSSCSRVSSLPRATLARAGLFHPWSTMRPTTRKGRGLMGKLAIRSWSTSESSLGFSSPSAEGMLWFSWLCRVDGGFDFL